MLKKGHRHSPNKEVDKLIDYLKRNPKFRGAAILMVHGKNVITTRCVGDLHGARATFKHAIALHRNYKLESLTE